MTHGTSPAPQQPTTAHLRTKLTEMADRLDHDPDNPANQTFTAVERLQLATNIGGNADFVDLLPRITEPTTRGAYAQRLRQIAGVR